MLVRHIRAGLILLVVFGAGGNVRAAEPGEGGGAAVAASAAVAPTNEFVGKAAMNGYSLAQYQDFLSWHLVTVRYRRDTGEMRFTYANPSAWEVMQKGGIDYPDGAVFAKIGIRTEDDPDFTSSAVPSGAHRYQLMVMDHKKNAATHGWGFALFDAKGTTFDEDPAKTTAACNACHEIVPQRGYVFSQPMQLHVGASDVIPAVAKEAPHLIFTTADITALPETMRILIPEDFTRIRMLHGPVEKSAFAGTLDEVRPLLAAQAMESKLPAALLSFDGKRFALVVPQVQQSCYEVFPGLWMKAYYIKPSGKLAKINDFCQPLPPPAQPAAQP